ncbi:MAG TPA: VOC family protein [Chitinophagaceae bacterium]|nr:VOC family protein [Chitinophagaceae bacterium]
MQLNHINLPVPDVKETQAFFERFFYFTCTATKGDGVISILRGKDNFLLVLNKLDEEKDNAYPRDFHIGFMLDTPEQVSAIYSRLKESGIDTGREPKKIRDSFGFYFIAPGNFMVEISCPVVQDNGEL